MWPQTTNCFHASELLVLENLAVFIFGEPYIHFGTGKKTHKVLPGMMEPESTTATTTTKKYHYCIKTANYK